MLELDIRPRRKFYRYYTTQYATGNAAPFSRSFDLFRPY